MNLELQNRVALVTGASRGIGLAIAKGLANEGAHVALNARNGKPLRTAQTEIGEDSSTHCADVTNEEGARQLIESVAERWGSLSVLVCNVGSGASVAPGQETEAEWRRVLELNLLATTNVITAARPLMAAADGDRAIVCISSICGLAALGAPVTYSAAKAALNAVVRGLARPLANDGIRINAVAPGNILFDGGVWARKLAEAPQSVSDMLSREVALGRLGAPSEIADVVSFLASPRASFITGTIVVADGGQIRG